MADAVEVRCLNGAKPPSSTNLSATELSKKLQKTMLRLKGEFMSEDGKKVNYKALMKSSLFEEYKKEAAQLHSVNLEGMSQHQLKVFFINIYNALTIHGLTEQAHLPDSVLKVNDFWKTIGYNVGGYIFSLDDMEHGILRGNKAHPMSVEPQLKAKDPRLKFTLTNPDPRIHFALVCGAKSCPAIQVYTEENMENALKLATQSFCKQEVSMYTEVDEIWLSPIFQWYREDFGETDTHVIKWISNYLEPSIKDRASILLLKLETQGTVAIKYNEYDWSLNTS